MIQPIVVYQEGDKYELLVGQRRYYAHKDVLKWTNILAMIIEKPESDEMSRTISWLENVARKQMSNSDKIRHVTNMLGKGATQDEVAKVLGISKAEVKRAVKLPSTPTVVQKACEKGEISIDNFRLPNEFEWEYAARASKALNPFPWGGPYRPLYDAICAPPRRGPGGLIQTYANQVSTIHSWQARRETS